MKKIIFIIFTFLLLTGCQHEIEQSSLNVGAEESDLKNQATSTEEVKIKPEEETEEIKIVKKEELPKTLNRAVLFAPQAPFANWDELHKEACEEAAMIIAAKYFKKENLNAQIMEDEILKLVQWEEENEYRIDLTAQEASQVLKDYFSLQANVVADTSVEAIKKYLAEDKLIIVPAAGRLLGNPYFRTPGPIYHMLVIRGYDRDEFITNDPGTKRGEGFKYKYQTLINAIHDWDHQLAQDGMTEEEMSLGQKVIIVVSR